MTDPAYLVEGQMEQKFVHSICNGSTTVRRIGVNGKDVSLEAIAKRVESHCRLLNNRYYPIVIVFDRETRTETSEGLRLGLLVELQKLGVPTDQICIGVPDKTTETWILADRNSLRENFDISINKENREGFANVGLLEVATKTSYHKTTTGVEMLKKASAAEIAMNSESFRILIDQLNQIDCHWKNT